MKGRKGEERKEEQIISVKACKVWGPKEKRGKKGRGWDCIVKDQPCVYVMCYVSRIKG